MLFAALGRRWGAGFVFECCSPRSANITAPASGGPGSCWLRMPRFAALPRASLGGAARFLALRVPGAAQKSPNAQGWPTEKRGRGNQPRPAATVSGDRMQLPRAGRCRFPPRWQPHAFCRGAPHKSGSREILSSPKDPSAMHAPGGSAEDEMAGESGRRLRWAQLCERLWQKAVARTRSCALRRVRAVSRSISPVPPALSTRTAGSWANLCHTVGVLPQCAVAARCGEIMRDSVRLQPSGS